ADAVFVGVAGSAEPVVELGGLVVGLDGQRAGSVDAGQAVHVAVVVAAVVLAGRVHRAQREAAPVRAGVVQAVACAAGDAAVAAEVEPVAEQAQAHHVGGADRRIAGRVVAAETHLAEAAGQADDRATAPELGVAAGGAGVPVHAGLDVERGL